MSIDKGGVEMDIKKHLDEKLALLVPVINKEADDKEKRELKWAKGKQGEIDFVTTHPETDELLIAKPTADERDRMSGLYIKGLMAKLAEGTIAVDISLIPEVVQRVDQNDDSNATIAHDKLRLSHIMSRVEQQFNIHILPFVKGKPVLFEGINFHKFVYIHNKTGNFREDFREQFKVAFDVYPAEAVMNDLPKHLVYLGSSISEDGSFGIKMNVFPDSWMKDELVSDGSAFYIPQKDPEVLMVQSYKTHKTKIRLDGNVLHVRGRSTTGYISKMTIQPMTFRGIRDEVKPEFADLLINLMKHGRVVVTSQALKKATVGEHTAKLWYHNDAKANQMLGRGKLMYTQLAEKLQFTHTDGLKELLEDNVREFAQACTSGAAMCEYLLKYKEKFNDETLPYKQFTDLFTQIQHGLPFGIHTSAAGSVRLAMSHILKTLCEIPAGTNKYIDKQGNVLFSFKEHNAIYMRGYLNIRSTHKRGEVGVPRFLFNKITNIVNHNHVAMSDLNVMLRRMPSTLTSAQKVNIVSREDDFPYITISVPDAKDLGGDVDGDNVDLCMFPKHIMDFDNITSESMNALEFGPRTTANIDEAVRIFSPERPSKIEDIKPLHNMMYELMASEAVGFVSYMTSSLGYKFITKHGWSRNMLNSFIFRMEHGPINAIIDGKKWSMEKVFSLVEASKQMFANKVYSMPEGFRMLSGKIKFNAQVDVENIPTMIKNLANGALDGWTPQNAAKSMVEPMKAEHRRIVSVFLPVQDTVLNALVEHMPKTMAGVVLSHVEHKATRAKTQALVSILSKRFNNLSKSPDDGGIGFVVNNAGRISHLYLEQYVREMRTIGDNDTIPQDEKQKMINRIKKPAFDKVMALCHTDVGRIATQMMLLVAAWENVGSADSKRGSTFSFVFNYVNLGVLVTFLELMKEDGDPDAFFRALVEKNQAINHDGEYNIVAVRKVMIVGDISGITPELIKPVLDNTEIVEDNPDELIVVGTSTDDYQKAKESGKPFHYFIRRSNGNWYYNLYK